MTCVRTYFLRENEYIAIKSTKYSSYQERKPFCSKGKYFIERISCSLLSDNDDIIGGKIKSAKHESTQGENLVKGMLSLNFQVNLPIDPYLVRELTTYLQT